MVIAVNELAEVYRPDTRDDLGTACTNIVHPCAQLVQNSRDFTGHVVAFAKFTFNYPLLNSSLECYARGEG